MNRSKKFGWTNVALGLLSIVTGLLIACQNKGSDTASTPQQYPIMGACPTCAGVLGEAPTLLRMRSQSVDGTATMLLDLRAQVVPPCYQPQNKAVICAGGPAVLIGTMQIVQSGLLCGATPGNYEIQPMEPSTMTQTVLFGGVLRAVAPNGAQLIMRLNKGILMNPTDGLDSFSANNRIALGLVVEAVNGMPCGSLLSTQ